MAKPKAKPKPSNAGGAQAGAPASEAGESTVVDIFCSRPKYQRAGLLFKKGWNKVDGALLTEEQFGALYEELAEGGPNALALRKGHELFEFLEGEYKPKFRTTN